MKSILVLGSGQLGLMMATYGGQVGLQIDRLDTNSCELLPGSSQVRVSTTLKQLLTQYDVITAEIEHLPCNDFLKALYQSSAWINHQAFTLLPDRNQQKSLLDQLAIPTADWQLINNEKAFIFNWLDLCRSDQIDHHINAIGPLCALMIKDELFSINVR